MNPSRFAGGFSKTPWTHPWGLSHKIPLVRVSKRLQRSAFVAASASLLFRKNAIRWDCQGRAGRVFSKPHKRDLVRQSPGMGSRRLLNTLPVRTGGSLTKLRLQLLECSHGSAVQRRSEEHTSELQSRGHLVCRLLLEKKKQIHSSLPN